MFVEVYHGVGMAVYEGDIAPEAPEGHIFVEVAADAPTQYLGQAWDGKAWTLPLLSTTRAVEVVPTVDQKLDAILAAVEALPKG